MFAAAVAALVLGPLAMPALAATATPGRTAPASVPATARASSSALNIGRDGPSRSKVVTAQSPLSNLNDYPWAGLTYQNGGDQWGMAYGQCVSYVAWKLYENFGGAQHPPVVPDAGWFPSDGLALGPARGSWGNAGNWAAAAASAGYTVNHTPTVGSVAQWDFNSDGGQFTVGHVAYVTAVNPDGSIDLAQYNLREDSKFSTLHMPPGGATDTSNGHGPFFVSWPDNFLHIGDSGVAAAGSGPAAFTYAASGGVLQQHVFARSADGQLEHWYWAPGTSVATQNWGGSPAGSPTGFVDNGEQDIYACDTSGQLEHWYWSPSSNGVHTQSWGGSCTGDPAGFVDGSEQDVFACNSSGQLEHWYWSPSSNGVHTQSWGGSCVGSPAAFTYPAGGGVVQQQVFARNSSGQLEHWYWAPGGRVATQNWGGSPAGNPAGFDYNGEQDVYACDTSGQLEHWYWSPSSSGTQSWGGSCAGSPAAFTYAATGGVLEQHVFAESTGGQLEHWYWAPGASVGTQNWGGSPVGGPAGFVYNAEQDLFAPGSNGHLEHWYWSPSSGGVHTQDWGGTPAS